MSFTVPLSTMAWASSRLMFGFMVIIWATSRFRSLLSFMIAASANRLASWEAASCPPSMPMLRRKFRIYPAPPFAVEMLIRLSRGIFSVSASTAALAVAYRIAWSALAPRFAADCMALPKVFAPAMPAPTREPPPVAAPRAIRAPVSAMPIPTS